MEKLIETIPKSRSEELRVALSEYRASSGTVHQMFSARVYFEDGPEFKPGRNGINLKVDHLPALIAALKKAEREAREAGLLADAKPEAETEAA